MILERERGLLHVWKFELGAISLLIIKLTLGAALNNSVGTVISLESASLGYKGRGAGWAQAGCHRLAL